MRASGEHMSRAQDGKGEKVVGQTCVASTMLCTRNKSYTYLCRKVLAPKLIVEMSWLKV
jgi:hypothetical protein